MVANHPPAIDQGVLQANGNVERPWVRAIEQPLCNKGFGLGRNLSICGAGPPFGRKNIQCAEVDAKRFREPEDQGFFVHCRRAHL